MHQHGLCLIYLVNRTIFTYLPKYIFKNLKILFNNFFVSMLIFDIMSKIVNGIHSRVRLLLIYFICIFFFSTYYKQHRVYPYRHGRHAYIGAFCWYTAAPSHRHCNQDSNDVRPEDKNQNRVSINVWNFISSRQHTSSYTSLIF